MPKQPKLSSLKRGDEHAWRWFYEEFYTPIYRYVFSKGISDAENITANIMEAVARSIIKFDGNHKSLRSWVFTVAHNHIIDEYRRQSRRPETVQEDPVQFVGQTDTYFEFNLSPDLKEALSTLNEDVQEMIMLRYVWELSTKEIAQHLNKSHSSVRVSIHRALKTIEEHLISAHREVQHEI